jgi:hypothetical protein
VWAVIAIFLLVLAALKHPAEEEPLLTNFGPIPDPVEEESAPAESVESADPADPADPDSGGSDSPGRASGDELATSAVEGDPR